MKKLFSVFLLLAAVNITVMTEKGACQWVQVVSGTSSFGSMVTNNQIIIAGSNGNGYFRSSNNGANWTHYYSLISEFITTLIIKNNILFAGTYSNGLRMSTNFGLNWSLSYSVNSGRCLVKNDSALYYATVYNVYKTTDNGANWALMNMTGLPSGFNTYSMTLDSLYLYLGSGNIYGVYKASISGGNWTAANSGLPSDYVQGLDVYNKLIFAAVGGTPTKVYRSSNYGASWELKVNGITAGADAMCITHYGSTLMLGSWNGLYVSLDSGNTWIDKTGNMSGQNITSITMNGDYVFAGTYDPGKVWRRPLSQVLNINNVVSNNIPDKFSLQQNYPNPFNAVSGIKYNIKKYSDVKLIVYDITGKIIETLIDEKQNAGEYELKFDGNAFSSGIYFYSLFADNIRIDTKKMVMIK